MVRKDTIIPKTFSSTIMRDDQSKTQLFEMLAEELAETEAETTLVATKGYDVISNKIISTENLSPCNKDDADTRVFCHVNDISNNHKKVLIITVDTDLSAIALGVFFDLNLDELWIQYGTSKDKRWIPIHLYA